MIVDFSGLKAGTKVYLTNLGPDEPFGGGEPGTDFKVADPETTGRVMEFRVVAATGVDPTTPVERLILPKRSGMPKVTKTRKVSINEMDSKTVRVVKETDGTLKLDDPKLLDLTKQALAILYDELPAFPSAQSRKIVPFNYTYWTGFPTSENPIYQPLYWFHGGRYTFEVLKPKK